MRRQIGESSIEPPVLWGGINGFIIHYNNLKLNPKIQGSLEFCKTLKSLLNSI